LKGRGLSRAVIAIESMGFAGGIKNYRVVKGHDFSQADKANRMNGLYRLRKNSYVPMKEEARG